MSQRGRMKGLALYSDVERKLWQQVEQKARQEHNAQNAREGEIAAQVFAQYLGTEGPLSAGVE